MNARARFQRLATGVLLVVVAYGILIFKLLGEAGSVSGPLRWLVTLLSSSAIYGLLVRACLAGIVRSDRMLALYWGGDLYFRGLWHYTSVYRDKIYLGVWRIDQDALGIRVRAFGLDENFQRRFTAFSVTDLMEFGGAPGVYEIVNARNDYDDYESGDLLVYSKTRMLPETPLRQRFLCRGPVVIRGETIVYGGARNGILNRDVVLRKHLDVKSEGELVAKLKREAVLPATSPAARQQGNTPTIESEAQTRATAGQVSADQADTQRPAVS